MPSKNPAQRLRDILENIELMGEFTRGLAYGGLSRIPRRVRCRPCLGDRLGSDPEIDWAAIAASGNVYRHEYEVVDESLVWYTARNGTEALRRMATVEMELLASDDAQ
jgi:uncharacterized protein with HEPN domain